MPLIAPGYPGSINFNWNHLLVVLIRRLQKTLITRNRCEIIFKSSFENRGKWAFVPMPRMINIITISHWPVPPPGLFCWKFKFIVYFETDGLLNFFWMVATRTCDLSILNRNAMRDLLTRKAMIRANFYFGSHDKIGTKFWLFGWTPYSWELAQAKLSMLLHIISKRRKTW